MLLFQVVKMVITSAHEPARLRGDLEPRYDYGLGVLSWQTLAPRFCARRAAASGRSTGHGARMPSLQNLKTVPENSQLNPQNLAASRPGLQWACSGCGIGHIRVPIRNLETSRSLHDTEPPISSLRPLLPASHNRQSRAGDLGRLWSRFPLPCRAGDRCASATTTNAGS